MTRQAPQQQRREDPGSATPAAPSSALAPPAINLPKGGGAIRGIGEKFVANAVTGTGSMTVPIATSPGRSGFGPELTLGYDSGSGNGTFGFGWSLSMPAITRKTDKGIPQYRDGEDSDVFILSGSEDLVPVLVQNPLGEWEPERLSARSVDGHKYLVRRYRPRVEGLFARIEQWTNTVDATDVFWRSISKDNITTWYGRTQESRIADPGDQRRIFSWLICQSHDDKGNAIVYGYKAEDSTSVLEDAAGTAVCKAHELNRTEATRSAQRYLKRIRYGNRVPYFPVLAENAPWPEPEEPASPDESDSWLFEAVFDYGEHDPPAPTPAGERAWPARVDPFSTYRAGFEIRTYRLCRRVLMFHHFPGEEGVGRGCLVRSTDFDYSPTANPLDIDRPMYTFLRGVTQTNYRRTDDGYQARSLPPLEFEYSEPIIQNKVELVDPASLENLPIGLDGSAYRWTDLHGEGLPGVLTEQGDAWFYKRNLSPVLHGAPDDQHELRARLAPLELVRAKPNVSLNRDAEFMDLAGDGRPDVVVLGGSAAGFYEHDGDEGWHPFRLFRSHLNLDLRDRNIRFVDLNGDGHADVLITSDDSLIWYPSLGEAGFGPPKRVAQAPNEEDGPRVVFTDGTESIYLADISGDGLTDIVRIRNREICYWPNLGYGRFGPKVSMDNPPRFDNPDQFDHRRIVLADIDGSGTTDIIYLDREGPRLYFNQSGNGWSQPSQLPAFPRIDNAVNVTAIDLLGNGTACLVWSSGLASDSRRQMRYVSLMGGTKPHMLVRTVNNLGAETHVDYAPSTKFYLLDKLAGRPWTSKLPFPVHVVEKITTHDHISRNRFVTRYAYHHGYFDGEEREFRGFGMVEQWDTEQFAALGLAGTAPGDNIAAASHVPPVHTKTWFHTGVSLERCHVSDYFAGLLSPTDQGEYFREPGLTDAEARALLLPDTVLPTGLTLAEEREACRALKGSMLRQEVYADDAGHADATPQQIARAQMPYSVAEQSFCIRPLQLRGGNRHAVFFTHAREAISYHYERNPADPRIQHQLTLEVDTHGNVLKQAAIGYGRRVSPLSTPWDRDRQTTPLLTYTENRVTNPVEASDAYRSPLPCEVITFELTGYRPTGPAGRFQASDLVEPDSVAPSRLRHKFTDEVAYEAEFTVNSCRRPIEWLRTLYRQDDLSDLLPLGELQPLSLPGESYKLAFTPGLLTGVFQRPHASQAAESLLPEPASVLGGQGGDRGGYVRSQTIKAHGHFPATDADDHWWTPSGRSFYSTNPIDDAATERAHARQHFFLPRRYRDPFGHNTVVDFDAHDLLLVETRDAFDNRVTVLANDYRVLQPRIVSDPNHNLTEVAFDTFGMVVGSAVMGKPLPAPVEGDSLVGFVSDLHQAEIDSFFTSANPHDAAGALLQSATTRMVYDFDRFRRTRQANPKDPAQWQPACVATLARETHASAPLPPHGLKIQLGFSYSDGFGREIQKKVQAEPEKVNGRVGPPRWVGSGWTIFNNKGKPVRQFEPFFSTTHGYEFNAIHGVSPVLFYDPAGRVIATLHPNQTYEKVVFDPWQQTTYDVNDTCAARNAQTGDPRNDPDIGAYVEEYFKTQPATWQTWYAQRIGNALGSDERNAAERAAAHADTPTTAHFDALGRPFLTIARNRVVCPSHDLNGTEESVATRVELDIEGNQRKVFDQRKLPDANNLPLGALQQRLVMQYAYDMLGNRIHQHSMEAGGRWMLNDVAGKPIRAWDSRGHNFTTKYDALRRPIEQAVRGTFSDPDPLKPNSDPRTLNRDILADRIEYGEPPLNATPAQEAEARRLNLRTRVLRHADSAGIATNARLDASGNPTEAYDFKGNSLRSTRQLVSNYTAIPDWLRNPRLDAETFESSTRYDALNRPIQSIAPHSSLTRPGHTNKFNIIQPVFNEANLLERVDVWLERAAEPDVLLDPVSDAPSPVGVADIDYDAKGQRTLIDYKTRDATVIRTTYAYDHDTFRLTHLYTRRGVSPATAQGVAFSDDCENPNPPATTIAAPAQPPARKACGLQNLHYTYDPAGNITHIRDDAQQTVYFRNQRVEPSNDYTYDALYRLIQADGREHLGQTVTGERLPPTAPHGFDAFHTRLDHPGDGNAMGAYTERYVYDAVGNFLQMQHRGSDPAHPGWTRVYSYAEGSLTEPGKLSNRLSRTEVGNGAAAAPETYLHDAHGNMLRMPHLGASGVEPNLHWDYKDQLHQVDKGGGGTAYYFYDASGQRMRKVWEKAPGLTEERIYLGGFEIFRTHGAAIGTNTAVLERETLHVMDEKQRTALVETRTLDTPRNDRAPRQLIRNQLGNHLGSTSLELDERAQIISYEEYAPYGRSTYQAVRSQTETTKRYRYTGKERDTESGLYYHGARFYAPWLGRWGACDPEGLRDDTNSYTYVQNRPTVAVDPDGRVVWFLAAAVVVAIVATPQIANAPGPNDRTYSRSTGELALSMAENAVAIYSVPRLLAGSAALIAERGIAAGGAAILTRLGGGLAVASSVQKVANKIDDSGKLGRLANLAIALYLLWPRTPSRPTSNEPPPTSNNPPSTAPPGNRAGDGQQSQSTASPPKSPPATAPAEKPPPVVEPAAPGHATADPAKTARKSEYGTYTNTHESGKTYAGMGGKQRSQASGAAKAKEYGDPHTSTDWTPAESKSHQRFDEALRIHEGGGAASESNFNKIETGKNVDPELYDDFTKYILRK